MAHQVHDESAGRPDGVDAAASPTGSDGRGASTHTGNTSPGLLQAMLPGTGEETSDFAPARATLDQVPVKLDMAGDEIGPYRLVSELGSGGMGAVWLAERCDGTLKRRVALKLPLQQWAPGQAGRVQRERDILASLEHPNIARLYDAGTTAQGRPYLALEYVEGKPICQYCSEHHLGVREKLGLFQQIAAAVSHAHGRLVVHRDLKPSNVLVTADGSVRLLDFGIARLLVADADGEQGADRVSAAVHTHFGARAMTPHYASPEQVAGGDATIASDVYSLGVLLFELLTGQRPYRVKRGSLAEIEAAILEQEAPRASSLAEKRVAARLRGDIDAILGKALQKNPQRRYQSVESFGDEIARHLAGMPVLAQPDSSWYRARKFVTRNWVVVASVSGVLVAIAAASALAIWQAQSARREAARAAEVKAFIASIFNRAVPRTGEGGQYLAIDLLTAASVRIETELSSNPRAAAELGIIVGESFGELGEPAKGERILKLAVAIAEKEFGRAHPITMRGKVQLASHLKHPDPKGARAMLDEVITDARKQLPETARTLQDALSSKGFIMSKTSPSDETYAVLKDSVLVAETYLGPNSEFAIQNLGLLANTYGTYGDRREQLVLATETLRRAEAAFATQRPNRALLAAERYYAAALRSNDRPKEAIPILRRVQDDQRKLDFAETGRVRYAMHELGLALAAAGELGEAIDVQKRVVEFEAVQNPYESDNRVIAGVPLVNSLLTVRRLAEVEELEKRLAAVQQRIGNEPPGREYARLNRRALLLSLQGRFAESDRVALDVAKRVTPDHQAHRAGALRIAAFNARMKNDAGASLAYLDRVAAIRLPAPVSIQHPLVDSAERGAALLELGRFDEADAQFRRCRQLQVQAQIRLSPRVATCVVGSARLALRRGQPQAAEKSLNELSDEWGRLNPGSGWHGEALHWLAVAWAQQGRHAEARILSKRARTMLRSSNIPYLRKLVAR